MLRAVHEEDIEANRGPWLGLNGAMTTQGVLDFETLRDLFETIGRDPRFHCGLKPGTEIDIDALS